LAIDLGGELSVYHSRIFTTPPFRAGSMARAPLAALCDTAWQSAGNAGCSVVDFHHRWCSTATCGRSSFNIFNGFSSESRVHPERVWRGGLRRVGGHKW